MRYVTLPWILAALTLTFTVAACAAPPPATSKGSADMAIKAEDLKPLNQPPEHWKPFLTDEAYHVMFEQGTERAFTCPLNEEHRKGTFVCAACHLPLFTSEQKFDSGTGWPSFNAPLAGHFGFTKDTEIGYVRDEYHCIRCGGHLGHVFDDGPPPTGQRWCTNGVAMIFVPEGQPLPELRS
ncbi:MAG TPA: peptide-methionine (R)-S-oxide reductase MsrB [Candidatus Eisenbacteria bacterium]